MAAEDENQSGDEGLSTPQKVVAGAALGVAIPAAVGVAKKLLGDNDDESPAPRRAGSSRRTRSSGRARKTSGRTKTAARKTAARRMRGRR